MFTDNFVKYLQNNNISAYSVAKNTGISQGLMNEYKNGVKLPTIHNLVKIADYLDCSVDYLLGRTDQPSNTASITGNKNVIQQGSISNSPVNFNTNAPLNEIETELINILRTFTVKQKMKLLTYAYEIKENDIK